MLRIAQIFLLVAAGASSAGAQTPDDLSFRLRLTKDSPQYAPDEPIEFEVSLSSSSAQKYFASWTALTPVGGSMIRLEPANNAVDLGAMVDVWAGSILGSSGMLSATPVKETGELTEWYRFEKAGHFRLSVEVNWVSRNRNKEEGGGKERLTLRSNEVEFEIVARDAASEAEQLETVLGEIDQARSELERIKPLHRLDLMQTPAAAEQKVRRYLANERLSYGAYYAMLQHSSQLDVVVPMLERALTDPHSDTPDGLPYVLSRLQARRQMGERPPWPSDAAEQERWQEKERKRADLADELFAQYSETLRKSLTTRTGPERVNALFEVWVNAEGRYGTGEPPQLLVELRSEVLGVSRELSRNQQAQLLATGWDKIPHAELLPSIERMARSKSEGPGDARVVAYKYWCQDWPEDCAKAIVADAQSLAEMGDIETILLLSEAEHPELDDVLTRKLEALETGKANGGAVGIAALILRAGSKNIQEAVRKCLDLPPRPQSCVGQGYLMAYLFRIGAPDAARRLAAKLQDEQQAWLAHGTLQELGRGQHIERAMAVVMAALNSPNLKIAGPAALFLAALGPESSRLTLMKRLEAFRAEWRERAGEVAEADSPDQRAFDANQFEKALVSALAHARAWKLTPEEGEWLAKGCMSEQCQRFAKGDGWMGL